jgi:hypothetical protein
MNRARAVRVALVLSLLMASSLPAFGVVCRTCTEFGCEAVPAHTNTWCKFVLDPANCRLVASPDCTPSDPPSIAMMGEFEVSSIEITQPSESTAIVSNDQPAVTEPETAAGAPRK